MAVLNVRVEGFSLCSADIEPLRPSDLFIAGSGVTRSRSRNGCAGFGAVPAVAGGSMRGQGGWTYLYCVVDHEGNTIDFYLSPSHCVKAVAHFLGKALEGFYH